MKAIRLNGWGNSYPEGQPIYTVEIQKNGSWFPKGTKLEVMESLNPSFKGKWRINDSQFISKDYCKVIDELLPRKIVFPTEFESVSSL